jgi:hypothetical protein
MDIITNYATSEEAVGAIFGGEQDKGKRKEEEPEGSTRAQREITTRRKTSRASAKPWLMTLSLPLTARSLEDPPAGTFLTKCSKNRVPIIRGLRTTTSRTATCCGDTLKA